MWLSLEGHKGLMSDCVLSDMKIAIPLLSPNLCVSLVSFCTQPVWAGNQLFLVYLQYQLLSWLNIGSDEVELCGCFIQRKVWL